MVKDPDDPCPHLLEGVINVIGDKWSILIIGTVGNFGTLRFQEPKDNLGDNLGAISPKTLAEKLRRLEAAASSGARASTKCRRGSNIPSPEMANPCGPP